jgi:RNA polymerase sigma factor (sigma-70 family)
MHDDATLLRRYAEERSEEAFAELVRRHLNLVYFAALRRTGGDAPTAEDVAQQVFTALARDATALWRHGVLTGWLYTTTRNLALKAMRTEHRRQLREQEALAVQALASDPAADAHWQRLQPVLDGALDELNDTDRTAVLLRYFDNRPFADIGAALRLSEDAARMRVDRALDRLRALLAKRGIDSTSAALAAALANQAVGSAPAGLAASIAGAALSGAAAVETGAVAAVLAFMTATKTIVVLGIAAALTLATAVYQSSEARTATVALAAESKAHAAARDRLADLETKVRTAEQAVTERNQAVIQAVADTTKPGAAISSAEAEAAQQQQALQLYLDNHPLLQAAKAEADRALLWRNEAPDLQGLGLTPAQVEQALEMRVEDWVREKAKRGQDPQASLNSARLRAMFGDARWISKRRRKCRGSTRRAPPTSNCRPSTTGS